MKRAGFTMIELIFVIVILGILAAVAIPKLSATRDDAKIAKMSTNAASVVADIGAYYTAKGAMGANWDDMTNVSLESGAGTASTAITTTAKLYNGADECMTFDINGSTLTVAAGSVTTAGSVCKTVQDAQIGLTKAHTFGGSAVVQ